LFKSVVEKILYISVGISCRHYGKAPLFLADFVTPRHGEALRETYVDGNRMTVIS